ncbi:MAG: PilT/PilU family type 4a pilus ATPase [bacterium]
MATAATATNQRLSEIIAKVGILPANMLEQLMKRADTLDEWLGRVAIDDGILGEKELAEMISNEMRCQLVMPRTLPPNSAAMDHLPFETCRNNDVLPIDYRAGVLTIAVSNPLDSALIITIKTITGNELDVKIAPRNELQNTISQWYAERRQQSAPQANTQSFTPSFGMPTSGTVGHSSEESSGDITLDDLLMHMMEYRASDLHLAVGSTPMMRVHGELIPMPFPVMKPMRLQEIIYGILSDPQVTTYESKWELDCAYSMPRISRFRVNVHRQRGSIGAVIRTIPNEIPSLDKLHMPSIVREMTVRPRGLVLVTGPTGSGKSTTLAAMIDEINATRRTHIVTVEDPIEFLHKNKQSVVTQREVGSDTESFNTALRHVLRQDPDIILIGEMRDLETIQAAVTAAETGHLVFATLHTTSAMQTIERVIDVFPPHQQEQIRSQLSNTLEGIFCQNLVPNIDGKGRSCAQEILIATPAIRNLIREGKVHQMGSVLQASAKYGMQTMDNALKQLVQNRKVSLEEATLKSTNPDEFKSFVAML